MAIYTVSACSHSASSSAVRRCNQVGELHILHLPIESVFMLVSAPELLTTASTGPPDERQSFPLSSGKASVHQEVCGSFCMTSIKVFLLRCPSERPV